MGTAQADHKNTRIEPFVYPASPHSAVLPDWQGWGAEPHIEDSEPTGPATAARTQSQLEADAAYEKRLTEETRRAHEAGRERGRMEGHQAEREAQAAALKAVEEQFRNRIADLIARFDQARDHYLLAVEREVVRLALAIAARILRREAQMDPLLLTGSVRVALGQLASTTEVRLRVPAKDIALWSDAISLLPNLALKPTVVAVEGMHLGECVIETVLGSVDLGIRSQLGEIERGFFDRAGASPSGAVTSSTALLIPDGENA